MRYRISRTPAALCPACGYQVDAASSLEGDDRPGPGDISLCLRCAAILEFGADLRPVAASAETLASLVPEHRALIGRARVAILVQRDLRPIPDRGGRA